MQNRECGPYYTNGAREDGCTMACTNMPSLAFASAAAPNGAGDACVWACPAGTFRKNNRTCALCIADAACEAGELFMPLACTPAALSPCTKCPTFDGLASLNASVLR